MTLYGPNDPAWEVDEALYEGWVAQNQAELAELAAKADDPEAGPEPGTYEWHIATGNYIDPEPDWDLGEPYVDERHGVMYYDTQAAYEAGRVKYPSYQHVGPEPETEAGLWHRSP
jgi:hypothetical protein